MLEVELNNPILKDGLRIIVPADIAAETAGEHYLSLKQIHSELYHKRDSVFKNYTPIYLYAVDRTGQNIFSDNIIASRIAARSEEDFWSTFNLYYMTRSESSEGDRNGDEGENCGDEVKLVSDEAAVFTAEVITNTIN